LAAPELRSLRNIHQFSLDDQRVAPLQQSPGEHGAHVQILPDLLRIDLSSLLANNGAACHDAQSTHLGEAVDHALSNAIAQVFSVGISAGIDEGQYRHRIDDLASPSKYAEP